VSNPPRVEVVHEELDASEGVEEQEQEGVDSCGAPEEEEQEEGVDSCGAAEEESVDREEGGEEEVESGSWDGMAMAKQC
jgi:hypothetical protein